MQVFLTKACHVDWLYTLQSSQAATFRKKFSFLLILFRPHLCFHTPSTEQFREAVQQILLMSQVVGSTTSTEWLYWKGPPLKSSSSTVFCKGVICCKFVTHSFKHQLSILHGKVADPRSRSSDQRSRSPSQQATLARQSLPGAKLIDRHASCRP